MNNRRVAFRAIARAALVVTVPDAARFAALERGFAGRERPEWRVRPGNAAARTAMHRLPGAGRLRPRRTRDPDAAAWLAWLAHRLSQSDPKHDAAGGGPDADILRALEGAARDRARGTGGAPRRCPDAHPALPGGIEAGTLHVDAELDLELSAAGIRYLAPATLAPRTLVACALGLPGAERSIGALAETVREAVPIEGGEGGEGGAAVLVALRFVRVDEADRDAIARHVMACQRTAMRVSGAPAGGDTLRA